GVFVAITIPASAVGLPLTWGEPYRVGNQTSTKAYIMANDRSQALKIRAAWMRKMGFSEDEIAEACADDGSPVDLNEELENLRSAEVLKEITPPASVLESWTIKR